MVTFLNYYPQGFYFQCKPKAGMGHLIFPKRKVRLMKVIQMTDLYIYTWDSISGFENEAKNISGGHILVGPTLHICNRL